MVGLEVRVMYAVDMGEGQEEEAGQEVGTLVEAGAPDVISGWHGGRM